MTEKNEVVKDIKCEKNTESICLTAVVLGIAPKISSTDTDTVTLIPIPKH